MSCGGSPPGPRPGSYLLRFDLPRPLVLAVGRLGEIRLASGALYYVGSALGPGGVAARVRRHLAGGGRPHWHVDRLRAVLPVREVWYRHAPERLEHAWAAALLACAGGSVAAVRFGASDCRCPTHLVHFIQAPTRAGLRRALGRELICWRSAH